MMKRKANLFILMIIPIIIVFLAINCFMLQKRIETLEQSISTIQEQQLTLSKDQLRLTDAIANWLEEWQIDTFGPSNYSPEEQFLMLATAIDNEARNQPYIGKVAVGAVIINRVQHHKFKDSISDVILSPGQFCELRYIGDKIHPESIKAAKAAIKGYDPTDGALYFYNPATAKSEWIKSKQKLIQIADHIFAR